MTAYRRLRVAIRRHPLPLPLWLRARLVRHMSADLLFQAVGNLEGRDEFFWLRRQAWAEVHRVLAIHPSRDRFADTGWEFGLEGEINRLIFAPLLASAYRARRDERLSGWLDDFVRVRWADCRRCYLNARAKERVERRRARDIERRMRGHASQRNDRPLLSALRSALAAAAPSGHGGVGLIITGPGSPRLQQYGPALDQLQAAGVPVVWLGLDPDAPAEGLSVRQQSWGLEAAVPLPDPDELISADPTALAEYARLLSRVEPALRRLSRSSADLVPISLQKWLAASLTARRVFDSLPVRFVLVLVDKTAETRAFVIEARRRGIPTFFHYRSFDLGAPQYWPLSDRILVSNQARAERLTDCLSVPHWRIEPVGDLEIDEVLSEVRIADPSRVRSSDFRLTFLLKWPAETAFGRPEQLLMLLRALPGGPPPWTFVIRPNPRDDHDYGWLEEALPGLIRVVGSRYAYRDGLAETIASADLVVTAMGNAAYCTIAAGKPTVIYNPDPKIDFNHDRLFARDDLPRHLRLALDRDSLISLLARAQAGEDPGLLDPEPLAPSLVRYLFHSLDGGTADRLAEALLRVSARAPSPSPAQVRTASLSTR